MSFGGRNRSSYFERCRAQNLETNGNRTILCLGAKLRPQISAPGTDLSATVGAFCASHARQRNVPRFLVGPYSIALIGEEYGAEVFLAGTTREGIYAIICIAGSVA